MSSTFSLFFPGTVAEASSLLRELGESARVYAGGTELMILNRYGFTTFDHLVDIKRIPGLAAVSTDPEGAVRIGATATHHQLERDALIRSGLPMLAEAESQIGNIRIRNQGTLGGNLCYTDPNSDPMAPLLVYEATVDLERGRADRRSMPLDDFLAGHYQNALEPDEVLTSVQARPLPPGWQECYLRIEHLSRPTATAAVAVSAETDGRSRGPRGAVIREARLAVGGVSPRALRLDDLERRLHGVPAADAARVVAEHTGYLSRRLAPHADGLGSAEYKIHLVAALLRRGIARCTGGDDGHGI